MLDFAIYVLRDYVLRNLCVMLEINAPYSTYYTLGTNHFLTNSDILKNTDKTLSHVFPYILIVDIIKLYHLIAANNIVTLDIFSQNKNTI